MGIKVGVSINTPRRKTIRTVGIAPAVSVLKDLQDVDMSDADQNEVPVYDETTKKLIVKTIPVLDGGTF